MTGARPSVSVIVPFSGDTAAARRMLGAFEGLRLRDGDELIVVDNGPEPAVDGVAGNDAVKIVRATKERSSYYARNVGVEHASNDWFVFTDSDCRPSPTLLDDYFCQEVDPSWGEVAGTVVAPSDQSSLIAAWGRSRGRLDAAYYLGHPFRPFAATANVLVRRAAYESVGGFLEGIRSGGDVDFSWRLQECGWTLGHRAEAVVEHPHRPDLRAFVRTDVRYAAGHGWLNRRWPGSLPRYRLRPVFRYLFDVLLYALPRRQYARLRFLDAVDRVSQSFGYLLSNTPPLSGPLDRTGGLCLVVTHFPELPQTFVLNEIRALERLGQPVRVESLYRPVRPQRGAAHGLRVSYLEDDGAARQVVALLRLCGRHPLRCLRDKVASRRWQRGGEPVPRLRQIAPAALRLARHEDRHLHAHFADSAGLLAMRLARLSGRPYSVTAHAFEIYRRPWNLEEKLRNAAFVTSGCDYTVRHLRGLVPERAEHIHKVVMGVDPEHFRRGRSHPGGRTVAAVGRLVEKKGFRHLIDAVAMLPDGERPERVVIVGEGPLREGLERRIGELGLNGTIELPGAAEPAQVRELLEGADLLAMPCVIAADRDRDSMPVVVKEALAMEVPVVASDEVGLPELVRPEWGRLVRPGDPGALAEAIQELLDLPAADRLAMGRAGRGFVIENCHVERETERLLELVDGRA